MAIRISGMISGMDTDSMVKELVSAYQKKTDDYKKKQQKLEWKQDAWKELNAKIYKLYTNTFNRTLSSNYNKKKTVSSDESKATVVAANGSVIGTQSLKINELAKSGYLTGAEIGDGKQELTRDSSLQDMGVSVPSSFNITVGNEEKTIELTSSMKISDLVSELNKAGVTASFDEKNQRFFVSSKSSGEKNDFDISATKDASGNEIASSVDALKAMGLFYSAPKEDGAPATPGEAYKISGSDAEIVLNGATFTSDTNNFSINGLTITAKGKTVGDETLTLSTDTDVDAIYDSIKEFIKEYNELIKEMDTLYNAKSAKGYEPLTDDEKDSMSDKEVEKWETKIKDSILRRDGTLSSVTSLLKNAMQKSFEIDGEKFSLSSFGIKTGGYFDSGENEKGVYHIDGDADDSITSGKEDKLKTMIASDPDKVASFFSKLSKNLYDELGKKMSSTTLSSAFTVYNDKQMKNEYDQYTKSIKKWEDYVTEQEEKWYKKFSAMETALAKLQSSTSALAGLLGS